MPAWAARDPVRRRSPAPTRCWIDESEISPKFSLGYEPGLWKFRYSFGQAYRFPVIAELYQSLRSPTSITTANALLKPEDGVHHNFTAASSSALWLF
ncbi:MAG: TonB-dependent receptor domain-containing protein [bacterium]